MILHGRLDLIPIRAFTRESHDVVNDLLLVRRLLLLLRGLLLCLESLSFFLAGLLDLLSGLSLDLCDRIDGRLCQLG
jgi:hypothetical protein